MTGSDRERDVKALGLIIFAPSHADFDHEPDARLAALEVSRALGVYVEVVEVP